MGKQTSKLKPNSFKELAQQTEFTQEDLNKWYKSFVSTYRNQALSIEDFKKIYGDLFPFGDASKFAQQVFQQLDTNNDGVIDFRELVAWLSITCSGTVEERLRRAFVMYDLDGNGHISREEMVNIVRSIYTMVGIVDEAKAEKRVDDIFKKLDANVDGTLSMSEFVEGTKQDPSIMKLLQCDWETRFLDNFNETLCSSLSTKVSLSSRVSTPVQPRPSHLSKMNSSPVCKAGHLLLDKSISVPCHPVKPFLPKSAFSKDTSDSCNQ